jgi:hypothetical protein
MCALPILRVRRSAPLASSRYTVVCTVVYAGRGSGNPPGFREPTPGRGPTGRPGSAGRAGRAGKLLGHLLFCGYNYYSVIDEATCDWLVGWVMKTGGGNFRRRHGAGQAPSPPTVF